ncbi:phage holin [Gordonia sp. DT101]|uniref:phage holin n=1 Tax=Gordonia sp. DT101 TaxID=3416545 RepID=UPI003CF813A3
MSDFFTPERRRWMYRLALAVVALLVTYGIVGAEQVDPWMTLVTALLGLPLVTADKHIVGDEQEAE